MKRLAPYIGYAVILINSVIIGFHTKDVRDIISNLRTEIEYKNYKYDSLFYKHNELMLYGDSLLQSNRAIRDSASTRINNLIKYYEGIEEDFGNPSIMPDDSITSYIRKRIRDRYN
ncbi:hypothetical protein DSECCO2_120280 [anaerobic digester metagenome]